MLLDAAVRLLDRCRGQFQLKLAFRVEIVGREERRGLGDRDDRHRIPAILPYHWDAGDRTLARSAGGGHAGDFGTDLYH